MDIQQFTTPAVYIFGAVISLCVLMATHRPQTWLVDLVPENTVEPGGDILVPVGNKSNNRLMRVVTMRSETQCTAIDLKDQQHHNAVAMGIAATWPISMPIVLVLAMLTAFTSKQIAKSMTYKPRARKTADRGQVPDCMKEYVN